MQTPTAPCTSTLKISNLYAYPEPKLTTGS